MKKDTKKQKPTEKTGPQRAGFLLRTDEDVAPMLDLAAQASGEEKTRLINEALRLYLPRVVEMKETERAKLLQEFREKYGKKKD